MCHVGAYRYDKDRRMTRCCSRKTFFNNSRGRLLELPIGSSKRIHRVFVADLEDKIFLDRDFIRSYDFQRDLRHLENNIVLNRRSKAIVVVQLARDLQPRRAFISNSFDIGEEEKGRSSIVIHKLNTGDEENDKAISTSKNRENSKEILNDGSLSFT